MCVQPYLTTIIICMLRKSNHGGETLSIDSCVHIVQCTVGRNISYITAQITGCGVIHSLLIHCLEHID